MQLKYNGHNSHTPAIELPASKSISNRYLILKYLFDSGSEFTSLSNSRDTQLLKSALEEKKENYWFEDGATPTRFFIAYAAVKGLECKVDGNESLRKRSVEALVETLQNAGAEIEYLNQKGFLPIFIKKGTRQMSHLQVSRQISSQFASAIMLTAPLFSKHVHLLMSGENHSSSYIHMTLQCMKKFGIKSRFEPEGNSMIIDSNEFSAPDHIFCEPDWSGAGYFYSLCACLPNSRFILRNLRFSGLQGDEIASEIFSKLGVKSSIISEGIEIENTGISENNISVDLKDCIDLAPAIIATCAFLQKQAEFSGIENLIYKESDRIEAMNQNLKSFGCKLRQKNGYWKLEYFSMENNEKITIQTHHDHRIAMAFSIFAIKQEIDFDDTQCVEKSFPDFWNEWSKCNFVFINHGA